MSATAESNRAVLDRPGLFQQLRDAWLALVEGVRRHRDIERALDELGRMDDHVLRDIGLTRGEIAFVHRRDIIQRIDERAAGWR